MKKHVKVYLEGMKIQKLERFEDMYIPCEWCGGRAVDIHHLESRKSGGSKTKDYIENLMALCRKCHLDAEARKLSREELQEKHLSNLCKL